MVDTYLLPLPEALVLRPRPQGQVPWGRAQGSGTRALSSGPRSPGLGSWAPGPRLQAAVPGPRPCAMAIPLLPLQNVPKNVWYITYVSPLWYISCRRGYLSIKKEISSSATSSKLNLPMWQFLSVGARCAADGQLGRAGQS